MYLVWSGCVWLIFAQCGNLAKAFIQTFINFVLQVCVRVVCYSSITAGQPKYPLLFQYYTGTRLTRTLDPEYKQISL